MPHGEIKPSERKRATEEWAKSRKTTLVDWSVCRCSAARLPHRPHYGEIIQFEKEWKSVQAKINTHT